MKKINLLFLSLFLLFFLSACGIDVFDFLDAEMNRAVGNKDPKICMKMTEEGDEHRKKRCLIAVAEAKKDPSVCDLNEDAEDKDYCLQDVGIAMNDPSICKDIKTEGPRESCYLKVAQGTENADLCTKISDKTLQSNCIYDIARKKNDEKICALVEDTGIAANCYYDLAKAKDDVEICKSVSGDDDYRSYCFAYFAEKTKDETLCLEIEAGEDRDDCYKDVAILIDGDLL